MGEEVINKKWAVRWALTVALIVLMWFDVKWALYLSVTLLMLGAEGDHFVAELKAESENDIDRFAADQIVRLKR
jgi:hypothetical protein